MRFYGRLQPQVLNEPSKIGGKKSRVIKAEKPKKLFHFSFPTTKHYTINGTNDINHCPLKRFLNEFQLNLYQLGKLNIISLINYIFFL